MNVYDIIKKPVVTEKTELLRKEYNKYTFEVGGKNKTTLQIQGVENSWLVKDDIVQPVGRAIPLWLFGFLY